MTAFIGVRNSWLMADKKAVRTRDIASVRSFSAASSRELDGQLLSRLPFLSLGLKLLASLGVEGVRGERAQQVE
jgi:hypothetical protein